MTYESVSAFAGTWGLVWLVVLFLATMVYAIWPGNAKHFDRAADAPLRSDAETLKDGGVQ